MANRKKKVIAVLAVAVGLTLGTSGIADAVTVGVRGVFNGAHFVWSPKVKTITRGTTVRWRAVDGGHTVKSRGANWTYFRNLPRGASVARTFNRRGTFRYFCTIHGTVSNGVCTGMCGRIVVS
jgi:plastocyanin